MRLPICTPCRDCPLARPSPADTDEPGAATFYVGHQPHALPPRAPHCWTCALHLSGRFLGAECGCERYIRELIPPHY